MEANGLSVKMKQVEAKLGSVCRSEFTLYVLLQDVLFNEFSLKELVSSFHRALLFGYKSHQKGKKKPEGEESTRSSVSSRLLTQIEKCFLKPQ